MLHTAVHSSTPLAFKRYHGLLNGANQSPADGLLAWERVLRVHAQADETGARVNGQRLNAQRRTRRCGAGVARIKTSDQAHADAGGSEISTR